MYTVGQVAKLLGISRDTLKFYEEKGLINPRQDEENGYRKYSLIDISEIMIINFFRDLDIEIKKIQEIKSGDSLEQIQSILDEKERKLEDEIEHRRLLLDRIKDVKGNCKDIKENLGKVSVREMKPIIIKKEIDEKGDISELLSDILENHNVSGRIKKAVNLSGVSRIVIFGKDKVISEKYGFISKINEGNLEYKSLTGDEVNSESLENKVLYYEECIYFVVGVYMDSNEKNIDNSIIDVLNQKAKELNKELLGVSYVNLLFNGFKDDLGIQYLEIYTPIRDISKS